MKLPPLVGIWDFGSPAMLFWSVAALIPIVLHLLSRRTRHATPWAAMSFLQAALRKHARRLQIEQLLLLALRTLVLVLLAIALAEPLISLPSSGAPAGARGRTYTVLVLDGSYSMGYRAAERDRFEVARERARQLVTQGAQGDGFSLVLMADPPRSIIGDVAFDPDDVLQELDELNLTQGGASLVATLNEAQRVVESAATRHPRLIHHRVCFFTDLGQPSWDDVLSAEGRRRVGELAEIANLSIVDVGESGGTNVALTRLSADPALPLRGDRVRLEVELQNFGRNEATRQLDLRIDGRSVAERSLTIPPGGRTTSVFESRFDLPGEHVLEARLDDDPLDVDNRRWLSLPVRETLRVLCVQGKPGAARYLALALAPESSGAARIRPEIAGENAILERDLQEYDAVWLCNVGRFDREEVAQLDRFAKRGGGLIVSLGDQVQPQNYNQEAGGELPGMRVLPARLGDVLAGNPQLFDPLEYEHPIAAPFRGHERAGLLTAPIWRYFHLTPHESEDVETALVFQNTDPAVLAEPLGKGRSILVATSLSLASTDPTSDPPTAWSALATWPSFPPLVHSILANAIRGRAEPRNALVGESLVSPLPGVGAETSVTVVAPDKSLEKVPVRIDGADRRWQYGPTAQGGLYEADWDGSEDQPKRFAVNVDTRESDLERLDRARLPRQIGDPVEYFDVAASRAGANDAWPLFRVVLSVLLMLLVVETVLAYRFGGSLR